MARLRRRWALVTAMVLVVTLGAGTFTWVRHYRFGSVRRVLSHQVTRYLRQQLGADASIGDIVLGWNEIRLSDVRLPVDDHGSRLLISEAEVSVHLLDLASSPRDYSRALRGLKIHGAQLNLAVPVSEAKPAAPGEVLTLAVPARLYSTLLRFDSVKTMDVDSLWVCAIREGRQTFVARDVSISGERVSRGTFAVTGDGRYGRDPRATLSLSGQISAPQRTFDLNVLATIPPGSLAYLDGDLQCVRTEGGMVSVSAAARGDSAQVSMASSIHNLSIRAGDQDFRVPRLHAVTVGDTIAVDSLTIESPYGEAVLRGGLSLETRELNIEGTAQARFADTLNFTFRVCGPITQPTFALSAPTVVVGGRIFSQVWGEVSYDAGEIRVTALEFRDALGRGRFTGSVRLDSTWSWSAAGQFALDSTMTGGMWRPRFASIEVEARGNEHQFVPQARATSPDGKRLADISLHREGGDWIAELSDASGNSSAARVAVTGQGVSLTLDNAQVPLRALVRTPDGLLDPFTFVTATFDGNADSGRVRVRSALAADSMRILPRVLRTLDLTGKYNRQSDGSTEFSGEWIGVDGDGRPFHGEASLALRDQVLDVTQVVVDEAGTGSGEIDFARRNLNLQFDVTSVPFDRLPLMPLLARRARIMGRANGHCAVFGDLDSPEWTARLSVSEGAVLGVPGYWINLDASGKAAHVDLQQLEVGRDVQRIVSAEGWLDAEQNQVAITAETGSAQAEDFLLALSGHKGILSGVMDGRAAISGRLSHPDVEVDCRIADGLLFDEIHFNSLDLTASLSTPGDSAPVLRIPNIELIEGDHYAFSGYAESGLSESSPLHGHLQGGGDLLNLVDQLDRSFHSSGSFGGFAFDLGGTFGRPTLLNAYLKVDNGKFTYYPACPVPLDTRIEFTIGRSGVLETGEISLQDGDQQLRLLAGARVATAHPGLRPIVLTGTGANLGVIELRTSSQGMPVRLPGLMKPEWVGYVMSGAADVNPITLSLRTDSTLYISGDVVMRNARVTFPFVGGGEGPMRPVARWLVDRLEQAQWDLNVHVGPGIHYDEEITGLKNSELFAGLRDSPIFSTLADYLDHLSIDAVVDPADQPLELRQTISDSTFYLKGRLTSTHGRVDYLDQQFTIDKASCEFDETSILPVLDGRASTYVDSLGQRVPVYLTMYVIDRETQSRQSRGRLGDLTFVLEDAHGDPPENVLALMGYDVGNVGGKAQQVVASSIVRAVSRQWLDPIERRIERWTPLDEFSISPGGGRTTSLAHLQRQRAARDTLQSANVVRFFTGSQLTVGKYVANDVFVTYTGELAENEAAPESGRMSLLHLWNLEYRIKPVSPDLVVDLAVEYDEFERKRDESVSLKYSFALEP